MFTTGKHDVSRHIKYQFRNSELLSFIQY